MNRTPYMGPDRRKNRSGLVFKIAMVVLIIGIILLISYSCGKKEEKLDYSNMQLVQKQLPKDDAPVAVFETSMGTFKAVLFPDKAPNYCKFFTKLVNDGYYDGTYVFAVSNGVYFMGGSKTNDGVSNDDTDTTQLDLERSVDLLPIKGALCGYTQETGALMWKKKTATSYLLFVNNYDLTEEEQSELDDYIKQGKIVNESVADIIDENGGVLNWIEQHSIFAQVYDGMDVYEKICGYDVKDEETLQPIEDIKFDKVYMSTYGENKNDSAFAAEK